MTLLHVDNLTVRYPNETRPAVEGVCFSVAAGECVSLAGRSGSGKTQTALAIMGLQGPAADVSGRILFEGRDIRALPDAERRSLRARRISMVFQDPATALNPHLPVGEQLRLILEEHGLARGREARRRVIGMLEMTGLPDPERQARAYPWALSGGMRQRVMIASALIAGPSLVIADEPTTALDTTVQAQILALLRALREETGVALLLITHDFGVIANIAQRLVVVEEGRVIEEGATGSVIAGPRSEPTARLLDAARSDTVITAGPESKDTVLAAAGMSVVFRERPPGRIWNRQSLVAVKPTDLTLARGETLAIVGESGSGKTSLVRGILGLLTPEAGTVTFLGKTLARVLSRRSRAELAGLQLVFQDPVDSLNPARRVKETVAEPLRVHLPSLTAGQRHERTMAAIANVGLDSELADRYPHELSGGQAQRVAIARALILKPRVLVCDEAVASLDGLVRHEILELLASEQRSTGLSILFISHDLGVVRRISHRVMVMYMGRVVETAQRDALFTRPRHPYTRALLDAALTVDAKGPVSTLAGECPSMLRPPAGCTFHPRCTHALDRCRRESPPLVPLGEVNVACHRAGELDLGR